MSLGMQRDKIRIPLKQAELEGVLWLPADALGIVVCANSIAGPRMTPPNDYVGSVLRSARLGTLWVDLSGSGGVGQGTQEAEAPVELGDRIAAVCNWLGEHQATTDLPVALFGAGEAGAAALDLAATRPPCVCAVVTRGARTDIVGTAALARITAPTLLIVGSLDDAMIASHRGAYAALRCKKRLEIIPGGTRTFEEPGSLEVVARLTRSWFLQHAHFVVT